MPYSTNRAALIFTAFVVGASTYFLFNISDYGTALYQLVALGGWGIVALLTSGEYADTHDIPVWVAVLLVNVVVYLVPALILNSVFSKRTPVQIAWGIIAWCVVYLSLLFYLIPAIDGP